MMRDWILLVIACALVGSCLNLGDIHRSLERIEWKLGKK